MKQVRDGRGSGLVTMLGNAITCLLVSVFIFIFYFFLTGYVCTESPVVTHSNAVVMEEWQNSGILWSVVWLSVCSSTCISTNATFQHCVHAV